LKILVIPELDWIAALQNRVHKIFRRLAKNHEIHAIYFEHEKRGINKAFRLKSGIILHKPPSFYMKNMLSFYIFNIFPIYSYLNKIIQKYKIDIIVTTNFLFAPFAIRAAKKNSIPIVFDLVDFQPYHINYITFIPSILKRIGNSLLTTLLNYDIDHANHVITTGQPLSHYVRQRTNNKITLISNGVNDQLFNCAKDYSIIQKKFRKLAPIICFIGALEYWVDYPYLFQSISLLLKEFPSLHCLLIGPSRHFKLKKIQQVAANYKILEHVIFTGRIPYYQLYSYICASDVCILPFVKNYLTHCIIPMKLFEYLACDRPVISVNLAGIRSVAKDAVFYADTPVQLRDTIRLILTNVAEANAKIAIGKALVKKYSWTTIANQYEQVLQQVCWEHINTNQDE